MLLPPPGAPIAATGAAEGRLRGRELPGAPIGLFQGDELREWMVGLVL